MVPFVMNYTAIFWTIAIILTSVWYIPYIRDIFLGKTKPHIYTWLIWWILPILIFILQKNNGGGYGVYATLMTWIACLFIAWLSLKFGTKDLKMIDTIFLLLTFLSIGVWLWIKNPIFSMIFICGIDLFGFFPTCRKSFFAPYEESLSFYVISVIRYIFAIISLGVMNFVTLLFPVMWLIINWIFVLFLLWRRSRIIKTT